MKALVRYLSIVAALTAPIAALAQQNGPVTRAQVVAELVKLENAGYDPHATNDPHHPGNLMTAEARITATNAQSGVSRDGRPGTAIAGSTALPR
ncbi:DUF4148 domain-containing protein [Paraburkholderia silviterrae]|uniref:DUF4148 domain-containing protein n=1 Tax=Paraburkholderia silviterrae TaxID=2528715 RepID=A0A4R5M8G8_9BURK|nr:DUF4148 domain-containing protein [Paraburkholderia silviterrae]TDG22780.1 DUF4148 domain-containing protein [Paraburkholderia silviterrae]